MAAPALLLAIALLLALLALRPPGWFVLAAVIVLFLPGRWWRWRTRRFRRGLRLLRRGQPEAARRELSAFASELEADPNFARFQPYFNLGRRYPYLVATLANLGIAELQCGEPERALERFRAALAIEPAWVQARYGAATALRLRGDLEGAQAQARRAVEERPTYLPARLTLALVLREQGRLEEAEGVLAPLRAEGKEPEVLVAQLRDRWGGAGR